MKYLLSLLLAISLFGAILLFTVSCAPSEDPDDEPVGDDPSEGGTSDAGIYIPPFKVYADRNAVSFSEITYHTPDTAAFLTDLSRVTEMIRENASSAEEQIAAVKALCDRFSDITTMTSYAQLLLKQDIADTAAAQEYRALMEFRPRMMQSVECLMVAAANSPHASRLAAEVFLTDLTPYRDGVRYTDAAVDAMIREAGLEVEYLLLSEKTVTVEYQGRSDTLAAHLDRLRDSLGETSKDFLAARAECELLYRAALQSERARLYTSLVRVRREIADAVGAESYTALLYEKYGYSYTQKQMESLLSDVVSTVVPVYRRLYDDVFLFRDEASQSLTQAVHKTVNRLSSLYSEKGGMLTDAYSFMLQYALYDIDAAADGRASGSEILYLPSHDSPFLFLTATGKVTDYLSLASAFGEYLGLFRYGTEQTELTSLYGIGCELLTLRLLSSQVSDEVYTDLLYSAMQSVLLDLINKSFYAAAEARIYALSAEEITEEALSAIVAEVAASFGLSAEIDSISYLLNDETVYAPLTVQSSVLALLPAIELYYEESKTPGLGWEKYMVLFSEEAPIVTLSDAVTRLRLSSPFASGTVKSLVSDIFYEIYGANFYEATSIYIS